MTKKQKPVAQRDKIPVTLGRGKAPKRVRDRVLAFLDRNSPLEFQPKIIASRVHARDFAVRKAIQRMLTEPMPPIVQIREGWYRSSFDIDKLRALRTLKRVGLHGIQIQGTCHAMNGGYSLAQKSNRKYRKRGTYSEVFNGRSVTITVYHNNTVQVWLNASKAPLEFEEFDKFCYWLFGLFSGIVLDHEWKLTQIGINVDMEKMHIEGFKSMTLRSWRNAWAQIYQKQKDVVRLEVHMIPDMRLQDALTVFGSFKEIVEGQYPAPDSGESGDKGDVMYG